MPSDENKLYLLIGEVKAGVDDLKISHSRTQIDIKKIQEDLKKVEIRSNGIKPVLSGAGLGGLFGAMAAYITKFFT